MGLCVRKPAEPELASWANKTEKAFGIAPGVDVSVIPNATAVIPSTPIVQAGEPVVQNENQEVRKYSKSTISSLSWGIDDEISNAKEACVPGLDDNEACVPSLNDKEACVPGLNDKEACVPGLNDKEGCVPGLNRPPELPDTKLTAADVSVPPRAPQNAAKALTTRRASFSDWAVGGYKAVKRSSIGEAGAALQTLVDGVMNSSVSSLAPCCKKFNAFFFKLPTSHLADGGLLPPPNPDEPVATVHFKRLLYESHTVWYILLFFRGEYWVGMRPKPMLLVEQMKRVQAGAADRKEMAKFSWETVARRYIFTRVWKVLEKAPTSRVDVICSTISSEAWGVRGIERSHPLAKNPNLVISVSGEYRADDMPWVTEVPHLMDVMPPKVTPGKRHSETSLRRSM